MKLTIERAALLKGLAHIQSVVERRNTIPILSNVMLRAEHGRLALSATDMDLEIVETVDAQVAGEGAATAPAHTLYDIVRKLREGSQIELQMSGDKAAMTLRSGRSTFTLACLPSEDYPLMTGGELPHNFSLQASELKGLIDRTKFAISTEETRYYLNGIFLHATKSGDTEVLRAVATDGHRLARVEMLLPDGAAGMPGIIVPRKTVAELRKLIDESELEIGIALSDTKIRFVFGDAVLTSKLIDGTFPDYDRVIPTNNDKLLEVECKPFAEAVDRVSTISTEKSRAVKLALERGTVTLSALAAESGRSFKYFSTSFSSSTPFRRLRSRTRTSRSHGVFWLCMVVSFWGAPSAVESERWCCLRRLAAFSGLSPQRDEVCDQVDVRREGLLGPLDLAVGRGSDFEHGDVEPENFAGQRVIGVDHARVLVDFEHREGDPLPVVRFGDELVAHRDFARVREVRPLDLEDGLGVVLAVPVGRRHDDRTKVPFRHPLDAALEPGNELPIAVQVRKRLLVVGAVHHGAVFVVERICERHERVGAHLHAKGHFEGPGFCHAPPPTASRVVIALLRQFFAA